MPREPRNTCGRDLSPAKRKPAGAAGSSRSRRNSTATRTTIGWLRKQDRLLPGDQATIALVQTTAAALDRATASYDVAVLGRVHLAAVFALLKGHATPEDDELDRAVNFLIRGAALRDTPKP